MTRALQSVLGLVLIAAGVYAFLMVPGRGDVASLVLVMIGGFMVSKSLVIELLKVAAPYIPWKRDG